MTFKASEDSVRKALAEMDLELYAYKPPDQPGPRQNWKPCDFMVWWRDEEGMARDVDAPARSTWLEVKETPGVRSCAVSLWRPMQRAGMRRAAELGIPYLSVVRWPKLRTWTIGRASLVLSAIDEGRTSIPEPAWPIRCAPGQLASHLRAAMLGEGI